MGSGIKSCGIEYHDFGSLVESPKGDICYRKVSQVSYKGLVNKKWQNRILGLEDFFYQEVPGLLDHNGKGTHKKITPIKFSTSCTC